MQESLLVQRLRARESQAVRHQAPRVDSSETQISEPPAEMNSADLAEVIGTDAQTFDRF
jgi:hypothetical protein